MTLATYLKEEMSSESKKEHQAEHSVRQGVTGKAASQEEAGHPAACCKVLHCIRMENTRTSVR